MESVSEDMNAEGKSGAAPDWERLDSEETRVAKERTQKCFIVFERANNERYRAGLELGRALACLRETLEYGQLTTTLEQLGISDETARYWIILWGD